jgi:hypothetical protein
MSLVLFWISHASILTLYSWSLVCHAVNLVNPVILASNPAKEEGYFKHKKEL